MTRLRRVLVLTLLCGGCAEVLSEGAPSGPLAAVPAPSSLGGTWLVELVVPPGQPFAGTYQGTLVLDDDGGALRGAVGGWSNGARSRLSGWRDGDLVRLERVDDPPFAGFRSSLTGALLPGGALEGTFRNDPSAPHGNGATGTWRAARVR